MTSTIAAAERANLPQAANPYRCSRPDARNLMRQMEGGFLGTLAANGLVSYLPSEKYGGGDDYMSLWGCCSPEGMRTLWTVWSNAATETDEGVAC